MGLDHAAITGVTATLVRDLRYAVRILLQNPGFALVAIGSLALAIGGSLAVFTLLNAVVSGRCLSMNPIVCSRRCV